MHEDKFEKQVREKMDQLGFDPADAVWSRVSKEINKEKKRRLPLLWLFLFSGLLLAGGGYYMTKNVENVKNIKNVKNTQNVENGKNAVNVQNGKKIENIEDGKNGKFLERKEVKKSIALLGRGFMNDKIPVNHFKGENKKSYRRDVAGISQHEMKDQSASPNETPNAGQNKYTVSASGSAGVNQSVNENKSQQGVPATDKDLNSENKIPVGDPANEKKSANILIIPEGVPATDKKTTPGKKQERWEIGFTGLAGLSDIKQGSFVSNISTNNPNSANASTGNVQVPAAASPVSEIQAGFSFGMGIFANRNLSHRITLSAGIDYRYFSTHVKTGDTVNGAVFNIYGPSGLSGNYYRNGSVQAYTNSYHFLELPVSLNFQLNKSHQLPVILEAGLSFGYLLSSNALFFDPNTNVYVKSNQSFHKAQLNATTALMFGFHLNQAQLRVGPQIQYGITGLTKQGYGASEHLLYYGMKVSFIPRRK